MTREWRSLAQLCIITSFICLLSVFTLLWLRSRWNKGALAVIISIRRILVLSCLPFFTELWEVKTGIKCKSDTWRVYSTNIIFQNDNDASKHQFCNQDFRFRWTGMSSSTEPKYHREIPNSINSPISCSFWSYSSAPRLLRHRQSFSTESAGKLLFL